MQNAMILLDNGLMVSVDMKPYLVDKSHPNYTKVVEAVQSERWDEIPNLVNISRALEAFGSGRVQVDTDNGVVLYNGEELHGTLTDRMLRMMRENFSVEPLVAFLENLMQNPSKRSVDELYGFLEHGKMPITEDGHFLAYKRVRNDYKSVHDGKTENSVGMIVEMERNKVDDNKDSLCSYGLHFCSHEYLSHYSGERVVVLKVNPRDVVSIPTDYNNTKGRACRYEVVGELSADEVNKAVRGDNWDTSVNNDYDDRDNDGDDWNKERESERAYEDRSASYIAGYNRGREDGRNGTTQEGDSVIVMEYVTNTIDFIDGYKRGHKDGKGHKARPDFRAVEVAAPAAPTAEVVSDEYQDGYTDGYDDGLYGNRMDNDTTDPFSDYAKGYDRGYADGEVGNDEAVFIVK